MDMISKAFSYVDEHRDEMLDFWKELVNLEGKVDEPELVSLVCERIAKEMESMGAHYKVLDVGNDKAGTLVGILGSERKGKPIIFGGHMDTVFNKGEFGEKPFKIQDGKAYGPGALDMKGGITIALFVAKALTYAGYNERPIKFIFSGDEENGHKGSIGGKIMQEEGSGGICAFNMETGPISNNLCTSRSTSIRVVATVKGVSAHAGNNFTAGRNAVVEAAHKLIEMEKQITCLEKGTTCNPAVISGGTIVNTVPDNCVVKFDIRVKTYEEQDRVLKAIKEILEKPVIEGTSIEYEIDQSNLVIYFNTDEVQKFFEFVNTSAKKHGFAEFGQTYLGGSSDAGNIVVGGTPAICSFGVRGEWNHTYREYAVVDSLFERAKIISSVICELKGMESF